MHIPKLHSLTSRTTSSQDGALPLIPSSPIGEVCTKLSRNTLTELKVGYVADEFRSKRDVDALVRVIKEKFFPQANQDKFTCLQSIRVGWRLERGVMMPLLEQVLPMLLEHPAPVMVRHLQLAVDSWLPEPLIRRLVSKNTLVELDLRMTRIRTRCVSDRTRYNHHHRGRMVAPMRGKRSGSGSGTDHAKDNTSSVRSCDSIVSKEDASSSLDDSVIRIVPYISPTITTLRLVDCDLRNHNVLDLCRFLNDRSGPKLETLSLRHNRRLDPDRSMWSELLGIPGLKSLDVSLCDFVAADGVYIADALREQDPSTSSLISLSVAGNYRMAQSIPQLVRAASTCLVRLDCSFCDVQNQQMSKIFRYLSKKHNGTLQAFLMQGSRIKDSTELVNCVRNNVTLKSLVLNHPKGRTESFPLDVPTLKALGEALEHNYRLQVLNIDCERQYLKHMEPWEFWLELNRCGRCRVLNENPTSGYKSRFPVLSTQIPWAPALAKAASLEDKNILHWLVRHGISQF